MPAASGAEQASAAKRALPSGEKARGRLVRGASFMVRVLPPTCAICARSQWSVPRGWQSACRQPPAERRRPEGFGRRAPGPGTSCGGRQAAKDLTLGGLTDNNVRLIRVRRSFLAAGGDPPVALAQIEKAFDRNCSQKQGPCLRTSSRAISKGTPGAPLTTGTLARTGPE